MEKETKGEKETSPDNLGLFLHQPFVKNGEGNKKESIISLLQFCMILHHLLVVTQQRPSKGRAKMADMKEGWRNYIRTTQGMIIVAQIPLAVIGGVLALALSSNAFWSFVYWSHAITASIIVALNVFNIMPALEKKFALMPKVLVVYSFAYTVLYGISAVISFVSFALSGVLIYFLFALCVVDLFFKYRAYKSGTSDVVASNPAATAASGGEIPKY